MKHPEPERLSAFLDGDTDLQEARELEEHLAACVSCASVLRDLHALRDEAKALPERLPPRDLWPEISRAIGNESSADPAIIPLYSGGRAGGSRARRFLRLTWPQAAAAALALALFSGATGAYMSPRGEPVAAPASQGASWVQMVGQAIPALKSSALEAQRLEAFLETYRQDLRPETARTLEKNLQVIDRAIQESLQALGTDPGNQFLVQHLEEAVRAKDEYLRDATRLVAPVG